MNCQDVDKFIHAYLDGEFAESDRVLFDAHLAQCAHCNDVARFEQAFRRRVRECYGAAVAPQALRERIAAQIAAERGSSRGWLRNWGWKIAPAFAVALALVGFVVSQRAEVSEFVDESVATHRQALPLDVSGDAEERVRRYFSDKVSFAVRPPRFANAKLVGARLGHLRGRRAAYLTYQTPKGRKLSVFVVDPRSLPSVVSDRGVTWDGRGGYNVGMYVAGGTGYAVASDIDRGKLVKLISHAQ